MAKKKHRKRGLPQAHKKAEDSINHPLTPLLSKGGESEIRNQGAPLPTKHAPAPKTRPILSLRSIIVLATLLILGVFSYAFFLKKNANQPSVNSNSASIHEAISRIDFTGTEPQVIAKIKALQKEVAENPKSGPAWGKLAMNLDAHDFKNESIACYKQAEVLDQNDFRWPYYAALVLNEIGSPQALPLFERSLTLKPDYAATHIRYGQALFQAKRLEEASREFNFALDAEPGSSHAYLGLAQIALAQGNTEVARSNLQKAMESNPKHGEAHGLLSEVYRRLNMPEEAHRELVISQQLPKNKPLHDRLELEMIAEGVSSYWYDLRGRAYMDQGSYEEAIRELKLAVHAAPDARLHNTLGVAFLRSKKYPEAAEQHRAALALNPNSVNSMNNLAAALFEMGKTEEAIQWLKKAIQIQPNFAASYDHLGKLAMRTGNRGDAVQAYRHGHEQLPDDPQLALQLAWLLATTSDSSLRDGRKAFQIANAVCKKNNYSDPEGLYVLAAAYAEGGEFTGAVKLAQRAHQIATASGQTQLANQIKDQLKFYEAETPYRE